MRKFTEDIDRLKLYILGLEEIIEEQWDPEYIELQTRNIINDIKLLTNDYKKEYNETIKEEIYAKSNKS